MKSPFTLSLILVAFMFNSCSHQQVYQTKVQEMDFDYSAENLKSTCKQQQESLVKAIDEIAKTPLEQANFQNTVEKLETVSTEFSSTITPAIFLKYVSPKADVRTAADKCEVEVEKLNVDIFAREDLFAVIKAAKDKGAKIGEKATRLIDDYMRDFRRNGLELPPEKRKIFIKKKKELVSIESKFSKNLLEWKDHLAVSKKELAGMDKAFISSLEKTKGGKYKLTLAYPHYYPFMRNAKNADARRRLQIKFFRRGGRENLKLLERAIVLRHQLATMLGKTNHADFVLEKRMAKDAKEVRGFLGELAKKLKPKGEENLKELLALKQEELKNPKIKKIQPYDWRYYANLLKKKKHQVDSQLIKEYFPLDTVFNGMFEIYQSLLGVKFVLDKNAKTWHESVRCYLVQQDGKTIALFYADLFPREGKYGHAAAFNIQSGYELADGSYSAPASAIVANFNAPHKENP